MKVLVRATNWVGDAVLSLPALRAIRGARPGVELTVLARPSVAELYTRENLADHVMTCQPNGLRGRLRLAGEIAERRFDCAILLPNSFDAALVARLARIPRRIGYARDARGWLLTDAVPVPRPGEIPPHQRFYYLELLRRAGFIADYPRSEQIRLAADADAGREQFRVLGLRAEAVIGVSPGAAYGSAKRWLPDRFAAAAAALAGEWDAEVALFGSAAERGICEKIAARIGRRAFNLAGRTSLGAFIDLAAACAAFLTNDSGAMHIASAVGVPTVAVFGPTDESATGPCGPRCEIVRTPVECSPCLLRECPIDHRCMQRVETAAVEQAARRLIALVPHGHPVEDH